jgi:hypothetical protein
MLSASAGATIQTRNGNVYIGYQAFIRLGVLVAVEFAG